MIKRLDLSGITRRQAVWPARSHDPTDGGLFSGREPFRKVLVLVDAELLTDGAPAAWPGAESASARSLLAGLLEHQLVRALRYADEGPPSTVKPAAGPSGSGFYDGWVVLENRDPRDGVWSVVYPTEDGYSLSGVIGNAPDAAFGDTRSDAYGYLPPAAAAERRKSDALAAQVASQAIHADIYVTEREYLAAGSSVARGVTICRPEEAVALLGLYLRAQGEFLIAPGVGFNRGWFFWVGARELLPEAWRWFSACVKFASGSGDDSLLLLGGSLLQRVDRALEARDAIHIALNQPQNNDLKEDALANLDVVLVLLMGAVDAAARVAHRALGLPRANEYRAAWQDKRTGGWLSRVGATAPALAAVVDAGASGEQTLTILRLLRNSVHGAALQGIAVLNAGASRQSLIGLPAAEDALILAAMRSLGGESSWGVRSSVPGRSHVDPGVLVDRLFGAVMSLLNELMAETPVELLPGVTLSAADAQAPVPLPGQHFDPFAPWIRQSIKMQLGFD